MTLAYSSDCMPTRLSTDAADEIEPFGLRMAFAKDEEIFGQDEDADLIYRLVSGVVRTSRLTSDGRRQIGDFYYPGDVFGLEVGDAHRYAAEALSDCMVLALKPSTLRHLGAEDALDRILWQAATRELDRTQVRAQVPAAHRHRLDQDLPDLRRERGQLGLVELAQRLGSVDRFEQGIRQFRWPVRSVGSLRLIVPWS